MASQIKRALPNHISFFKGESPDDRERDRRLLRKKRGLRALSPFQRQKTVNGKSHRPLRSASKGLKAEQAKYRKVSAIFLSKPENFLCHICKVRREHGENILINGSTEIHHYALRAGKLLCYVPYFMASCFRCREFPHQNKKRARELGLLAPAHLCGIYPGEY